MSELIICEKPKVAEKVAKALSDSPVKNSYKRVPYYEIVKDNGELSLEFMTKIKNKKKLKFEFFFFKKS